MSEDYSDDFSRGSDLLEKNKKVEIFIDEEVVDDQDDRGLEQRINRIDHGSKRLKKPKNFRSGNSGENVFIAENPFKFHEPDRYTHWKTIDKVDVRNIIRGDIQQLNTVNNELAFSNFNDPAFGKPTKKGLFIS